MVFTILTIQFLHSSVFGVIETPYLHLFVTIAATLFATGLLLRKCQFRSAVFASQLMNLVQWGTFIVTASVLKRLDFTSVRLSSSDKKIFFCIYLCAAAVIAIACWFFGRRRVSGTETVAE